MRDQLVDVLYQFVGENYGSQEMADPCYNLEEMADYIIECMKFGEGVSFERVRRITGYLVGDTSRWNNAKKAELNDRVVHTKKEV